MKDGNEKACNYYTGQLLETRKSVIEKHEWNQNSYYESILRWSYIMQIE